MKRNPDFFSLAEISTYLLNEVIRADSDFQIRQQEAWFAFEKDHEWYSELLNREFVRGGSDNADELAKQIGQMNLREGYSKEEYLKVDSLQFGFDMVAYEENFFKKIWRKITGKKPPPKNAFAFCEKKKLNNQIHVTITISRTNSGNLKPEFKTEPGLISSPEETHVAGIIR